MRRIAHIAAVSAACIAVGAVSADARSPRTQVTDPSADSPAGVIYSIPLDSARQDASPHHSSSSGKSAGTSAGGGSGGGSGPGAGGSSGAGPSGGSGSTGGSGAASAGSSTSGASSGSGGAAAATQSKAGRGSKNLVPGGQPGSLIHSANGFGSSSQVPGAGAPLPPGLAAADTNDSSGPPLAVVLALVVLALGVYAGARSWHVSRSGRT
jgi:hypothetical protein